MKKQAIEKGTKVEVLGKGEGVVKHVSFKDAEPFPIEVYAVELSTGETKHFTADELKA
ncbi:MAG TPA: hypothetical protein P5056_02875 [Candidatus Paceibacterota bacterium]|nr:hypothetical protein [Candidatus Paceibacterota bacterium]